MATFPFSGPGVIDQLRISWRDAKGNIAKSKFYIDYAATSRDNGAAHEATLLTALKALSNAAVQNVNGLDSQYGVAQYGLHAPSDYQNVEQKAVMVFQDAAGQLHRFMIPAPKVGIFLADRQTVDPTVATVITFITQMTVVDVNGVYVATRQDIPLSNFMGGYFAAKKLQRRGNVLVLTPSLTPSEPAE